MFARAVLAVVLLSFLPSASAAQLAQNREGFGISFGFGGGSGAAACDGCSGDRETGLSGYLRLGGYARPHVFVGFESNGYTKSLDGVDITGGFYQAVVQWYPNASTGFFVKGGAGLMAYLETDGIDEITASALGMSVGLGYDARVGRNFSLTPFANILFSAKSDAKFNGASTGLDASFNLVQIGLGFTWH